MSSWQPPFWHHFWWDFSEQQTISRRSRCSVRFLFFQFHNFHILFVHCSFFRPHTTSVLHLSRLLNIFKDSTACKDRLRLKAFWESPCWCKYMLLWLCNCVVFSTFIQVRTWKTRCHRVIATSGTRSSRWELAHYYCLPFFFLRASWEPKTTSI